MGEVGGARLRPRSLQPRGAATDAEGMDGTAYAFTHGVRRTRETLRAWQSRPGRVLARWFAGAGLAALGLLLSVWLIASLSGHHEQIVVLRPPFAVGGLDDVVTVLERNMLVLALHAMACVAGFIAGSSLPLQVEGRSGVSRWLHEHGGRVAIAFVVAATTFSLSAQAYLLGRTLGGVAAFLRVAPGTLDVVTNDPTWADWSIRQLDAAPLKGPLAINDVVYAELSVRFASIETLDAVLEQAGIAMESISRASLFLAGKVFLRYREAGGQRTGVLPDFFIGAHAAVAGFSLLTRDAQRYRAYFPTVELVTP